MYRMVFVERRDQLRAALLSDGEAAVVLSPALSKPERRAAVAVAVGRPRLRELLCRGRLIRDTQKHTYKGCTLVAVSRCREAGAALSAMHGLALEGAPNCLSARHDQQDRHRQLCFSTQLS